MIRAIKIYAKATWEMKWALWFLIMAAYFLVEFFIQVWHNQTLMAMFCLVGVIVCSDSSVEESRKVTESEI